jgi:lipoprotein NlpI
LLAEAQQAAAQGDSLRAVEQATLALAQDNQLAEAYYLRGRERFRLGQFGSSAADFDRFLQVRPEQRSRLWERGISCYYADRFQDGAEQFAAYQEFDNSDVENAVWHVLCLSRLEGLAEARKKMMRVKFDARIPMMAIYRLFLGELTPEDVLRDVQSRQLSDSTRKVAEFYARLYIGLYYEAAGQDQRAREFLSAAAKTYRVNHYMWDVARVHAARWSAKGSTP